MAHNNNGFNAMLTTFDRAVETMRINVRVAIRRMKRDGVTGASYDCLEQNTRTTGLVCTAAEYKRAFKVAATDEARKARFTVYN